MGEHVPHRAGALTFVGRKEIVELQHTGKKDEQGVPAAGVRQFGNRLLEPSQREQCRSLKKSRHRR